MVIDSSALFVCSSASLARRVSPHRTGIEDQAELARREWRRFGKGRHPAAIDFRDGFAYALAGSRRQPLLFCGARISRPPKSKAIRSLDDVLV